MHWWYLPILLFLGSIVVSYVSAPKDRYEAGKMAQRLIVLGLLVASIASCSGGVLARLWP